MVKFHTMDLILTLCQRVDKHVVIEKHYSQKFGDAESKKIRTIKCRHSNNCKDSDCKLAKKGNPNIYVQLN